MTEEELAALMVRLRATGPGHTPDTLIMSPSAYEQLQQVMAPESAARALEPGAGVAPFRTPAEIRLRSFGLSIQVDENLGREDSPFFLLMQQSGRAMQRRQQQMAVDLLGIAIPDPMPLLGYPRGDAVTRMRNEWTADFRELVEALPADASKPANSPEPEPAPVPVDPRIHRRLRLPIE